MSFTRIKVNHTFPFQSWSSTTMFTIFFVHVFSSCWHRLPENLTFPSICRICNFLIFSDPSYLLYYLRVTPLEADKASVDMDHVSAPSKKSLIRQVTNAFSRFKRYTPRFISIGRGLWNALHAEWIPTVTASAYPLACPITFQGNTAHIRFQIQLHQLLLSMLD